MLKEILMYRHYIRRYHIKSKHHHVFKGLFINRKHMIGLLNGWNNEDWIYAPTSKPKDVKNIQTQDHTTERTYLANT